MSKLRIRRKPERVSWREWMRLEMLMWLGVGASEATVSGYRRPLGYQQLTLTGTAQKLTLPTPPPASGLIPGYAIIQCEGSTAVARWRDDGTAPTATIGMILNTGAELDYSGDIGTIQFIIGSSSPVLDISYYA
jgi:hypothetical protein